jgi:hypothetical protein
MKWVTFTVAFLLTTALVISGIMVYPEILGKAASANNDFVFELFFGPFIVLLFFAWVGEKMVLRVWRKKE